MKTNKKKKKLKERKVRFFLNLATTNNRKNNIKE